MIAMRIGIGIDTGGTSTDAVLLDLDTHAVLDSAKALTTHYDLMTGILNALDGLEPNGFCKSVKTLVFADSELEAISQMCGVKIEDHRCIIPAEKLVCHESIREAAEQLRAEGEEDIYVVTCFSDRDKFLSQTQRQQ